LAFLLPGRVKLNCGLNPKSEPTRKATSTQSGQLTTSYDYNDAGRVLSETYTSGLLSGYGVTNTYNSLNPAPHFWTGVCNHGALKGETELDSLPKGDNLKARSAMKLKEQTTVTYQWIANRLAMGSRSYSYVQNLVYGQRR